MRSPRIQRTKGSATLAPYVQCSQHPWNIELEPPTLDRPVPDRVRALASQLALTKMGVMMDAGCAAIMEPKLATMSAMFATWKLTASWVSNSAWMKNTQSSPPADAHQLTGLFSACFSATRSAHWASSSLVSETLSGRQVKVT